ncbi:MAG: DUF1934 domain-containing protein [Clostridium sp.]|uniref:DUF1934 domain-containing protein n=1 Tax=Clostridium sp. TaxID=1506 RepID=UPI002FCC2561
MDDSIKVLISVKTIQTFEDDIDEVELVTEGTFKNMGDYYLGEYDESEISGMKGTHTRIEIYPDRVNLIREGSTNSNLSFKLLEDHVSLYGTKHGAFEVGVKTRKIKIDITDEGGVIELDYIIETKKVAVSHNILTLTITKLD